jgi:hypothetical protein
MNYAAFVSYAHSDSEIVRGLIECVKHALNRSGTNAGIWIDRSIRLGDDWKRVIFDDQIPSAQIFLLFISDAYLAASDVAQREMYDAVKRAAAGEALVIPICLQSGSQFAETPLSRLQGILPEDISTEAGKKRSCQRIASRIRQALKEYSDSTANHLLISDISDFSREIRELLLRDARRFRIGPRPSFRRYETAMKDGKKEQAQGAYVEDYKEGLEAFLSDGLEGNWLFTMYPEETHSLWGSAYESGVLLPTLRKLKKRVICFESGSVLLKLELERLIAEFKAANGHLPEGTEITALAQVPRADNRVCVIQTRFAESAQSVIRLYLSRHLSAIANLRFVLMPGPRCDVMEERWSEYRRFLWAIQAQHEGLPSKDHTFNIADQQILDGINSMSRRPLLDITAVQALHTWEYKEARPAVERLINAAKFAYGEWMTFFLCGNDDIALAAHDALWASNEWAVKNRKISFIGFDGTEAMRTMLKNAEGRTVEVQKDRMCDEAGKLIDSETIPLQLRLAGKLYDPGANRDLKATAG